MKRKLLVGIIAFFIPLSALKAQFRSDTIYSTTSAKGTNVYQGDWESIRQSYQFSQWFQDAKFGIFIHWGVYSVPAAGTEWYARNMYIEGSHEYKYHLEKYGKHVDIGYKDFIPLFKGDKFNADEWVQLFKDAGARYVVPVAEHHDGFAMYDSKISPWNAAKMGSKKDIISLLQKAVEKEGLNFGLSTHRAENAWFYSEGMKLPSDVQDQNITLYGERLERNQVNARFMDNFMAHTCELVEHFKPQLIWFDWTVNSKNIMPYFNKFMAYYYNTAIDWRKEVVVNTKYGYPYDVMVWDVERGKSDVMKKFPWQTDTSVRKKSWSYIANEENKTPQQIVHDLVDIVSKNGNLLLNVGPRADGTITEEQESVLRNIGKWVKVNGEAIYGTRTWARYGEGKEKGASGAFTDSKATSYIVDDIRFTAKGNTLYATALGWKKGEILITSLSASGTRNLKIRSVAMLGCVEKISWEQKSEGLVIRLPEMKPCEYAYCFKIELDGIVFGETFTETDESSKLQISEYMYLHAQKPEILKTIVKSDSKGLHEEYFELTPSVRNEYTYTLENVPNGLRNIILQTDHFKTKVYTGLFPFVDFVRGWKFHRGDDMAWLKPGVNEKEWEFVDKLPQNWETHSGYDSARVYGWYRKTILIPSEWKKYKLYLPLGVIDDAGEVFLNETIIGTIGEFPLVYKPAKDMLLEVELPQSAIKYNKENVISIRIYDDRGDGGIVRGPIGPMKLIIKK